MSTEEFKNTILMKKKINILFTLTNTIHGVTPQYSAFHTCPLFYFDSFIPVDTTKPKDAVADLLVNDPPTLDWYKPI